MKHASIVMQRLGTSDVTENDRTIEAAAALYTGP
jgi:hypothetical protein